MLAAFLAAAATLAQAPTTHAFVARHNDFATRLLRVVAEDPGNALLSPYSVAVAMAMAREGARGETAAEIDRVLGLPEGGAGDHFAELSKLLAPAASGMRELGIANAMWGQSDYTFERSYIERLATGFGAQFFGADFAHDASGARDAINAWVLARTKERIKDLLPEGEPTPATRLVLVNAVYLKARWEAPFESWLTREAKFHAQKGELNVPTMCRTELCARTESQRADVLALPYAGGLEMLIVLPKQRDGLGDVIAHEGIADWTGKRAPVETTLWLPKFRFEHSSTLIPALQKLGIALAFEPGRADFGAIAPRATRPDQPLFIGVVRQKAWIAVDEEGTEAAAATEIGVRAGAEMHKQPPSKFRVDHPFLFVIRDAKTGLVLFTGRVDDPTAQ